MPRTSLLAYPDGNDPLQSSSSTLSITSGSRIIFDSDFSNYAGGSLNQALTLEDFGSTLPIGFAEHQRRTGQFDPW